jgi:hypothetical protein
MSQSVAGGIVNTSGGGMGNPGGLAGGRIGDETRELEGGVKVVDMLMVQMMREDVLVSGLYVVWMAVGFC